MSLELDQAESNTVLAALRFYQKAMVERPHEIAAVEEIAAPDGGPLPLDEDEIDSLCERLNLEQE